MYYIKDADNDNISASNIDYDNSNSGLISTNVQNGLDELSSSVNTINSNLANLDSKYIVKTVYTPTISVPSGSAMTSNKDVSLSGYKPIGVIGFANSRGIALCQCKLVGNVLVVQYLHFYGQSIDVNTSADILYEKVN